MRMRERIDLEIFGATDGVLFVESGVAGARQLMVVCAVSSQHLQPFVGGDNWARAAVSEETSKIIESLLTDEKGPKKGGRRFCPGPGEGHSTKI
jgi:hypothetical protein